MSAHLLVEDWFVARLVTALLCYRCACTDFKCVFSRALTSNLEG